MSRDTAASFFIPSPFWGKSAELYQVLLRGIESYHHLGKRLIQLAEHAHALRQFDRVREYGQILSHVPSKDYQAIGTYFLGVATHRKARGDQDEAKRLFQLAVDKAPDAYKVKAILSLGALSMRRKDFDSTLYYYRETIKAGKLSAASLIATRGIATVKSIEGYHQSAITDLENVLPVARYAPAHIYFDILNSYAVELGELGRKDEARNIMRLVLASPYALAYPEWRETAEELKAANRSSVVIGALPYPSRNVLFLPVEHERRQSSAEQNPAPVFDFQKWKAKMFKGEKVQNKKNRMSDKDILIRLMEILTDETTTLEQKHQIWEAAEKIISEPTKPNPDTSAS
jgi:tetratricopeptide (TPR) repeat protein